MDTKLHASQRTVRSKYLLGGRFTYGLCPGKIVFIILTACVSAHAQIALEAKLETGRGLHVGLRNDGQQNYFLLLGGLCDGRGAPAFHFTLREPGKADEPLELAYNSMGVVCGNPVVWSVFLPASTRYEFTFSFVELRIKRHMRQSLADLMSERSSVQVSYSITNAELERSLPNQGTKATSLWWSGALTTVVSLR